MKALLILVLALASIVALLYFRQHKMIYFPRPYDGWYDRSQYSRAERLAFSSSEGKQVAFYLPPQDLTKKLPERLWVVFGGNASLALDWYTFFSDFPDRSAAFLLVDYPGYGDGTGTATPETIEESANLALATLASKLGITKEEFESRLNVLGHSLGAAAALSFARGHKLSRLVLLSPFTSLSDMARRVVGYPLSLLLRHRYDNEEALEVVTKRANPPTIYIIHGSQDEIIPVEMGRALADRFREYVQYIEIEGGEHNTLLDTAKKQIVGVMIG